MEYSFPPKRKKLEYIPNSTAAEITNINNDTHTHKMGGDTTTKTKKSHHTYVYVTSKDHAWIPATLIDADQAAGQAHVEIPQYADEQSIVCDGGASAKTTKQEWVTLKNYPNHHLPLQNVTAKGDLIEYPDMVDIPFLHEVGYLLSCLFVCLFRVWFVVLRLSLPSDIFRILTTTILLFLFSPIHPIPTALILINCINRPVFCTI